VKNTVIVPVGAKGGFVLKRHRRPATAMRSWPRASPATDLPARPAGPHRQPGAARWCPLRDVVRHDGTIPTWWWPPTRARPPSPTSPTIVSRIRLLAGRCLCLGRLGRLRPQEAWASPRAAPGSRSSATSARWASTARAPTSPVSASATCRATCSATACCCRATSAGGGLRPPARLHRPEPGRGTLVRRARAPVQAAAFQLGRLRHLADLRRRRGVSALREIDPALARRRRCALGIDRVPDRLAPESCCRPS
jgi:hypothetical protein